MNFIKVREKKSPIKLTGEKENLPLMIAKMEKREIKYLDTSILKNSYRLDYNSCLDKNQKRVLLCQEGQYLVLAGAGSGKTHTMIYRVAWLIENGVNPKEILVITFTKKASDELKERVKKLLGENINLPVGTFHSFCLSLILKYKNIFEIGKVTIIEENEKLRLLKKYLRQEEEAKDYNEIKIKKFLEQILSKKEFEKDMEKRIVNSIITKYKKYKKMYQLFEFDDLIEITVKGLKKNSGFRECLQERIKYLIVDEYQDTNKEQCELLKLLTGDSGNIMVVGDDYQSIYGFRGADYKNILRFGDDYPKSKLLKMETNYRSYDEIIDYSKKIIKKFKVKYNKDIQGTGKKGGIVEINCFKTHKKEVEYIVEKILILIETYHYKIDEIAILYRNSYYLDEILKALKEKNINYIVNEISLDKLNIMSVHSSKGLEWKVVFLPVLLDGLFPSLIDIENIEEEKRLYYVAVSRAKERLYLSYPENYYSKLGYFDKKSTFL